MFWPRCLPLPPVFAAFVFLFLLSAVVLVVAASSFVFVLAALLAACRSTWSLEAVFDCSFYVCFNKLKWAAGEDDSDKYMLVFSGRASEADLEDYMSVTSGRAFEADLEDCELEVSGRETVSEWRHRRDPWKWHHQSLFERKFSKVCLCLIKERLPPPEFQAHPLF